MVVLGGQQRDPATHIQEYVVPQIHSSTKQTSRNRSRVFYLAILMEIYPKKIMVCTQRCVYKMFHSSLYKRRKWKQPKCLTLRDRLRDSLVAQWLRVHLPMQGMLVQSLVGEGRCQMLQGS